MEGGDGHLFSELIFQSSNHGFVGGDSSLEMNIFSQRMGSYHILEIVKHDPIGQARDQILHLFAALLMVNQIRLHEDRTAGTEVRGFF